MNSSAAPTKLFCIIFFLQFLEIAVKVKGQNEPVELEVLEFLSETIHNPGDGASFNQDRPTAPAIVRSGKKLCARELWALYTKPMYGMDDIRNVTVHPMRAGSAYECTGSASVAGILRRIQSFRKIAPAPTVVSDPPVTSFVEYCKYKYFLKSTGGDCSTNPIGSSSPTDIAPAMIESFAIRGTGFYKLCNDLAQMNCVCLEVTPSNPVMVPDLNYWPAKSNSFKSLTYFAKSYGMDSSLQCTSAPSTENPLTTPPEIPDTTTTETEVPDPTTTEPGIPDPTTTEPGTPDPTTTEPGIPDPTTTEPGTPDPTTTEPGTPDPTTTEPGTPDPTTTEPGIPDPTTTEPGTPDPTTTEPGTPDPTTTEPGTPDPTTTEPGTPDPTTTEPGTSDPTTTGCTTSPTVDSTT